MKILNSYFKELRYLRLYILLVSIVICLSYSVYLFFSNDIIAHIGDEDQLFEWLTALSFFFVSIIFLVLHLRTRNLYFLFFALIFFIGFGEEISWGQRIFNYQTPEAINRVNVQKEFTLHNLEIFNPIDNSGTFKHGFSKFLEVNFLFKVFTILFGIVLPFLAFHMKDISRLVSKFRLPVPPISIGIFFFINWIVFRVLLIYLLPKGQGIQFYDTDTEIYEFISAFILLVLGLYFFTKSDIAVPGRDIKQVLESGKEISVAERRTIKDEWILTYNMMIHSVKRLSKATFRSRARQLHKPVPYNEGRNITKRQ